jgi:hypothetical protein
MNHVFKNNNNDNLGPPGPQSWAINNLYVDNKTIATLTTSLEDHSSNIWSLKAEVSKLEQERDHLKMKRDEICEKLLQQSKIKSRR